MTGKYSSIELYNIKKDLITNIKSLSRDEHVQIFCIIKKAKVKYTENNNGIFINLQNVNTRVINKLLKFVEFAKVNNSELEKKNKIIDNIRQNTMSAI
jgi:hypothetical protein|tara:strand:+ start:270 stop:563 length:294 start_codon:yes stop_codon:yes gene_type:complete